MRKKTVLKYSFALILMILGLTLLGFAFHYQQQYAKFESMLSVERVGFITRPNIESYLNLLSIQMRLTLTFGILFLVLGIIFSVIFIKPLSVALILILAFSFVPVPFVNASSQYYQPSAYLSGTNPQGRIYNQVFASVIVRSEYFHGGFVAYLLGVRNPITFDFVEIGYFRNSSGSFIYSTSQLNGQYQLKTFGSASINSQLDLSIDGVGSFFGVYLNGTLKNSLVFSDASFIEYTVMAETIDSYNRMDNSFFNMQLSYSYYDFESGWQTAFIGWPLSEVQVYNIYPFQASLITASPSVTGVDISGGLGTGRFTDRTGGTGGGYITNIDAWDI